MEGFGMRTRATVLAALLAMVPAGAAAGTENESNDVTLTIVESRATEKTFVIRYRIVNGSRQDVWVCEGILVSPLGGGIDYEVYLPEGSETLVVRRRLNLFNLWDREFAVPPDATYLRLPAGEQRFESVILPLPIRPATVFFPRPDLEGTRHATRVRIEIGFHGYDLAEEVAGKAGPSAQRFRRYYETVQSRARVFMCPYRREQIKRERALWAEADVPRVAYGGEAMHSFPHPECPQPPDLAACTRVTVEYQPSMLEYFFPDAEDQSLLSPTEKEYLRSQRTTSPDDPAQITALNREIGRGRWSLIVAEEVRAKVLCHTGDKLLTSFTVFGDRRLLMGDGTQLLYPDPLRSLASLAPQIEPYRLRIQRACALKNLWYEVRYCQRDLAAATGGVSGASVNQYPAAARWNDIIREAYGMAWLKESGREGACEYAMNPACEPNSPADMVLLFETHVGWNRHGGPELFTFENYNPRGGLVLLHDGTAKFIRTEGELKQLRWK